MLAKLRLDQTGTYEKLVGARYISMMLVSFVQGQSHPLGIGAEQGKINKWDDFVIQENQIIKIHIQIKRQTDRFGTEFDECKRNVITRRGGKTEPRDLSELDKTIQSLGVWIREKKESDTYERKFRLELYEGGVEIKKGFKVRELKAILDVHFRRNVTTPEGFQDLYEKDDSTKKCVQWLDSWCDIKGFDQIVDLFKVLFIHISGDEPTIEDEIKLTLKNIFKPSSIDEIYTKIISYTSENSTFTGTIRPRHLLSILKDHLQPEVVRWTYFKRVGRNWNISGINDVEDNENIERPSIVVPSLWQSGNSNARHLKIDGECDDCCMLAKSLMRLSLHPLGSFDTICSDEHSWRNSIKNKTGGTLGVSERDLNNERLLGGLDSFTLSKSNELSTIEAQENFAEELHHEMYKKTFELVDNEIITKIQEMERCDLRTLLESRWSLWKKTLESSVEKQRILFSKMLRPEAEGKSILGELRVGPKTVDLLKEALFLLLVVSVCVSDEKNKNSWEFVTDKLKMTSIGLAYWSGPATGSKKVIEIDDDNGIKQLIGKESADILILGKSQSPASEIYNDDLTGSDLERIGLMSHGSIPKLLITRDRKFKKLVNESEIFVLKEHLKAQLKKYDDMINSAKQKVTL